MAIWQFKFSLVPASGIRRIHGSDVGVLREYQVTERSAKPTEIAEMTNYWDGSGSLRQLALAFSGILPEIKSWSDEARMFGDDESNKIEVWDDDVNCYIDARIFSDDLMNWIIKLARKFECKLVIHGSGLIIDPDFGILIDQIKDSTAYKFCLNPVEFLKGMDRPQ